MRSNVESLLREMGDDPEFVNFQAFSRIVDLGPDVVPVLIENLYSENRYLQRNAMWVLSRVHDRNAIPILLVKLKDSDPWIAYQALKALKEYNVEHVEDIQKHCPPEQKALVTEVISLIKKKEKLRRIMK